MSVRHVVYDPEAHASVRGTAAWDQLRTWLHRNGVDPDEVSPVVRIEVESSPGGRQWLSYGSEHGAGEAHEVLMQVDLPLAWRI